jgi:hypothetical protein
MGDSNLSFADTSLLEVTGALKATGSTDPDVLFAAKTEFGRSFRHQKVNGLIAVAAGAVTSFTALLVLIGIPLAIFGVWYWRKGERNLAVIDAAYVQYMATLISGAAASRLTGVPL